MSTLADLLAVPTFLTFEGKEYPLREPTLLEQCQFQRWLEDRAKAAAGRSVDLPADMQDRLLVAILQEVAIGTFEWGGLPSIMALRTKTGQAQLLHIILSPDHPEVTPEFAARMIDRHQREAVAAMAAKAVTDPKDLRAVLATLGLPVDFLSGLSPSHLSTNQPEKSSDSTIPNSSTFTTSSETTPAPPG